MTNWKRACLGLALLTMTRLLHGADAACSVPGFDRLHAIGGDWQTEAGEILFSELSCAACHGDSTARAAVPAFESGPNLSAAGDRLRADWIRGYLNDPSAEEPGTTMPHLLAGMDEALKKEMIEDLTHHLMNQRAKKQSTVEPVAGSAKSGRTLWLGVGCVACHGEQPMPGLGEKYAPGELARFLLSPLTVRPSGRMPDQHLGKKDVAHLAAYIAPDAPAKEPAFVVDAEAAARGRKAFMSLGCASCHENKAQTRPLPLVDLHKGCLSPEPKAGVPHYALSEVQREAIRAALAARGEPVRPQILVRRVMLQRNCFACHKRDDIGGPEKDIAVHFSSAKDDLAEVDESLPPEGLAARAALVLEPKERPIIFRTFLKGAGTHAIAIGFPGGVNVAFDALASRWSQAWRGRFLDADGAWNQRYPKMEHPLGEELVRLEDLGTIRVEAHDELKPVFRGYRIRTDGVPVFQYDLGVLQIEDCIEPGPDRSLKRTLSVTGQTNGAARLPAKPPAGVKVRIIEGARLEFRDGKTQIVEEITW